MVASGTNSAEKVSWLNEEVSMLQALCKKSRAQEIQAVRVNRSHTYVGFAIHSVFGPTLKTLNPFSCALSMESANAALSGSSMERQHAPILTM